MSSGASSLHRSLILVSDRRLRSFVWTACGQTGSDSMIPHEVFGMSFRDCHGVSKCSRTDRHLEIQGILHGVVVGDMGLLSQSVNHSVRDVHTIHQRASVMHELLYRSLSEIDV